MRATLLPLLLDTEAALGLVLEAADRLDAADAGDAAAATLVRVLTPIAKHTLCKRARSVTGETMEVRGGNGYIEDWVDPRLLRDAHLGSIWEGSSNVIALDVLRCMRKDQAHRTLAEAYTARLEALDAPPVKAAAGDLVVRWRDLLARGEELLAAETFAQQAGMAPYVDDVSHAVMATLLLEQAQRELVAGLGARKLLLAHTALQRLVVGSLVAPVALAVLDAIADGGHVDTALAVEAYDAIPAVRQEEARA